MFPRPVPPANWFNNTTTPANNGADAEVPPTIELACTAASIPFAQLLVLHRMKPSWSGDAAIATSGTSRTPSFGTPVPVCQDGLGKPLEQAPFIQLLAPPPLAESVPRETVSFHAISGM